MSETDVRVPVAGDRLTEAELRELFLFTELDDEQLAWISSHGDVVEVPMGEDVVAEADPATCFYVLLSGQIAMSRMIGGDRVETTRTDQRGVYFGAVQFYLNEDKARIYGATVEAVTDLRIFQLPAAEWGETVRSWFPMAIHLLDGIFLGMQNSQRLVNERERLLALGSLSAGLTHELNNPAAAASRRPAHAARRWPGPRRRPGCSARGSARPTASRGRAAAPAR